jgi:EAL domain-containing protein (putative c-di-GMP-specific phosphodiesterase class I)/anti-sigma regulatory factor (Ser/Thr protein kinase)
MSDVRSPSPMPRTSEGRRAARYGLQTTAMAAFASFLYGLLFAVVSWFVCDWTLEELPPLELIGFLGALAWLAIFLPMRKTTESTWGIAPGARARAAVRGIRRGIQRDELELHYQPQIDLQTGTAYGVEALLRWRRNGELVPPGDFLPAVESSDLMGPLTHRVLDMALLQASVWHRSGREIGVAVNLSAANLRDFKVVAQVRQLLAEHGVPASLLTLEVTETSVLDEPEQARAVLDALHDLGVSISIDDFGAGYSSLLWLRIFPATEVKIDRSFVSQLHDEGKAFVGGVIRLARDLDIRVVAEGVEDDSILDGLQALECEAAQGFLFAKPMPPEEVEAWLDSQGSCGRWARRETVLSFEPDIAELEAVRTLVETRAEQAGMGKADVWDMRVAATEALSNAIEHAPLAPDGLIHLRITQEQGELLLEITGGGNPNGTHATADPNRGRGIGIMTSLMDEVEMKHEDGAGVTRLAKKLQGPPAQRTAL